MKYFCISLNSFLLPLSAYSYDSTGASRTKYKDDKENYVNKKL